MSSTSGFQLDFNTLLAIIGIIAAAGSWVAGYYRRVLTQHKEMTEHKQWTQHEINELENKVMGLETKFNIFWCVIEKELPKLLIRPTHIQMDELLVKVMNGTITRNECLELKKEIEKELHEGLADTDSSKALAYIFMLARLEAKIRGV